MTTIKLKNGSGAPATSDLVQGEPALDLTNKRLYTENASGAVIEIGTSPSTIDINAGTIDGTVIGGSTAAAGTFTTITGTTITATGTVTINNDGGSSFSHSRIILDSNGASRAAGIFSHNQVNDTEWFFGNPYDTPDSFAINRQATASHNDSTSNKTNSLVTVSSSGNVGIGTTSPSFNSGSGLEISRANTCTLRVENTGTGASSAEFFAGNNKTVIGSTSNTHTEFRTNSTERMRIDSSGNVGINQSAPDAQLTLNPPNYTSTATGGMIKWKNSNNSGHSNIQSYFVAGEGTDINIGANAYINTSGAWSRWSTGLATSAVSCGRSGNISFITNTSSGNGITRAIIDNSGNLGLGTTTPSSYGGGFVVDDLGINIVTASSSSPGTNKLSWWSDNNGISQNAYISVVNNGATTNTGEMVFYTKNASATLAERMRIDASGALFVGATSASSSATGVKIQPNGYGGLSAAVNLVGSSSGSSNSGFSQYSTGAGAYRFYVDYAGTIFATSTSISAISDASLKENVRDLDKGLDTINALQPRRFDWKNGDGNDIMGFIAQEVEGVMPELVHEYKYSDEENKKGLKMGDMVPSMVKAIQELSAQVTELKAEVAALKGE